MVFSNLLNPTRQTRKLIYNFSVRVRSSIELAVAFGFARDSEAAIVERYFVDFGFNFRSFRDLLSVLNLVRPNLAL